MKTDFLGIIRNPSSITFITTLIIIGVVIRVAFTAAYRGGLDQPATHARCAADGVEYDLLARNLASGKGYCWNDGSPTSFRAPGFPLAMSLVYAVTDGSLTAIHLFFAACGGLSILGCYLFARELLNEYPARWVAIFATFYPPDIYMSSNFLSEIVFVPSLAFGLWLLQRHLRTFSLASVFLAGMLLGYSTLSRSFAILLLPLITVYLLTRPRSSRSISGAVIFATSFSMIILAWTARNYHVHHEFVLIATNGGSTFYGGNNDLVAGSLREHGNWISTTKLPGRDWIDSQPDEVSHDRAEYHLGVQWVKQHPVQFAKLAVFKVIRFWLPFVQWTSFKVYPIANIASTSPFLILILVGIFASHFRSSYLKHFALCHIALLANLVMVVIFWGEPRFRDANLPLLAIYGIIGASVLLRKPLLIDRAEIVNC